MCENFKSTQICAAKRHDSIYVAFSRPGRQHMLDIMKSPATAGNMKFDFFRDTKAHESPIDCLVMTHDGSLIATASVKGTLIRIFNLEGQLLKEVRRSRIHPAKAISMAFSECQNYLCCSFDSQTVHIFDLEKIESYEAVRDHRNSSYYQRFVRYPLVAAGECITGYNIDTVLCKTSDWTFKCDSRCPVILSVQVIKVKSTIRLIIDEGFYMPTHAYECDLRGIRKARKIDFDIKKEISANGLLWTF